MSNAKYIKSSQACYINGWYIVIYNSTYERSEMVERCKLCCFVIISQIYSMVHILKYYVFIIGTVSRNFRYDYSLCYLILNSKQHLDIKMYFIIFWIYILSLCEFIFSGWRLNAILSIMILDLLINNIYFLWLLNYTFKFYNHQYEFVDFHKNIINVLNINI